MANAPHAACMHVSPKSREGLLGVGGTLGLPAHSAPPPVGSTAALLLLGLSPWVWRLGPEASVS